MMGKICIRNTGNNGSYVAYVNFLLREDPPMYADSPLINLSVRDIAGHISLILRGQIIDQSTYPLKM